MSSEKRIRELLNIENHIKLYAIEKYEKKGRIFYRFTGWDQRRKKMVKIHIPRKLEDQVLYLWHQYQNYKKELKELEREVKVLLEKYKDAKKIKEVLEKLAEDSLIKTASSYAIKVYTTKAKELFKEYMGEFLKLYREGVLERLTVLQTLYLLVNLRELSKSSENPEYFFKKGISTIIRVCKNERIENPFGTLKNDFFLSGKKTPYDFLLSNFLEELIGDTLLELLKSEYEKQKAIEEAQKYKEKMEKLKDVVQWFEKQSPKVKSLAKEVISQNPLEIAEKILKELEETRISLKDVEEFLKNSSEKQIIQYFEYLRNLK